MLWGGGGEVEERWRSRAGAMSIELYRAIEGEEPLGAGVDLRGTSRGRGHGSGGAMLGSGHSPDCS